MLPPCLSMSLEVYANVPVAELRSLITHLFVTSEVCAQAQDFTRFG